MIRCCIFDLDGVIVDTARYHYLAWQRVACELGFELDSSVAEQTKGVSRMESLEIVLQAGGMAGRFSHAEKERLAAEKNESYLSYIAQMTSAELLPNVLCFLRELRTCGVKVALGSASKNAGVILDRCGIRPLFDVVVDGTQVTKTKPDPEVFALGAKLADCDPSECVVFEDAAAGIEAARRAGMRSVGVGDSEMLHAATFRIASFEGFSFRALCSVMHIN